jgi:hypothetical protein
VGIGSGSEVFSVVEDNKEYPMMEYVSDNVGHCNNEDNTAMGTMRTMLERQ